MKNKKYINLFKKNIKNIKKKPLNNVFQKLNISIY